MLGQRHTDFLIGEEPLEGDVSFFAASADADPPAAADPIAETTPGPRPGPLPAGRRLGRGSAIHLPRPPVATSQLVVGLLLAFCAAVVIVVLGSPTKPEDARPQSARAVKPTAIPPGSARDVDQRRHRTSARRGDARVTRAEGQATGVAVPARRRSRPPTPARGHARPEPTGPAPAETVAAERFSATAGATREVAQTTGAATPRSEFDFER